MSFWGKIHEISFYGLLTAIINLILKKLSFKYLFASALHPNGVSGVFVSFLFWASILFIPISIIGAVITKFADDGEGLTFQSDKILVIMFAHIAEELLGLFVTPIWVIKYLVEKDYEGWKTFDFITYFIEIIILITFSLFLL